MQRALVRKGPRIRKSDPEACHAEGCLGEAKPLLRRRDDEPRVRGVGSGIDDGVPAPNELLSLLQIERCFLPADAPKGASKPAHLILF